MRSKSLNDDEGGFGISDQEERLDSDAPDVLPGEGEEELDCTASIGFPKPSVDHFPRQSSWNQCIHILGDLHTSVNDKHRRSLSNHR